jgi:hypothetical protein
MKKSLKALFMASMLPVMMLMAAVTLTSCEGMLDDIFGEWSRPTNQQNNEPTEDEIEAAQIREAVALLEEAQKEGSITTMYFTVSGTDYEATFKKVGTEFVLQELKSTKAATRAGDDLEAKLELIEVEDDGDDEGDDDDGDDDDDDGDDEEGDDDEEDDPDDGTTWYDVDDSSEGDGGAGAGTRSNEIHKVSGTRGNVQVNLGMPVASNQEMHFTVTSKTTGEMLINFHTNMGNSETTQENVVTANVHSKATVNGKTRTLGSGDKECKITLPNKNVVIAKYNEGMKWNKLIAKHQKLSKKNGIVIYDKKYWVLKNGNAVKGGAQVKYSNYTSSTMVNGLSLYANVDKNKYSNNIDKNNFRKGDKIRVKVKFDKESEGAKMRDEFICSKSATLVSVSKVKGIKNEFEIEAVAEPTGNAELELFRVTFAYKDYDKVSKSIKFTGYVRSITEEINELYANISSSDDITKELISNFESIKGFLGDFLGYATTINETYAKALAEKICKENENNLTSVVLFMGGNDTNGYDFYVISGDSKSKTHLAFDDAIPAAWEGLTLFYVKK